MRHLIAICLFIASTPVWSQDESAKAKDAISNPFEAPLDEDYGMGMGIGPDMEDGMGGMMGMGMDASGMGMGDRPSADDLFRQNLPRAIARLKKSKTPAEKAAMQTFIREAFEQRYDRQMAKRKQDIYRLQASLADLENDLERRTAAKDRVVQLQLQSVQLAAEGLLELNDLQGVGNQGGMMGGMDEMMGGGMESMGGGMEMGGG